MDEQKKEEGNTAFQGGNFTEAVRLYTEGLTHAPASAVLYANRAAAYLALKQFKEAKADATKCLELDSTYTKAYLRLATAERALGNPQAALDVVRKGMGLFGENGKKAKAKKTGWNEFRRLEKELKLEVNKAGKGSPRSGRAAVEAAVRENATALNGDVVQQLGEKHVSALYKLQDLQGKMELRSRQLEEKKIIFGALENELGGSENKESLTTYRRMGKAYLLQNCNQILSDINSERENLDKEVQSLKKGEVVLKRNVEDAQRALNEYVRRRQ